MAEGNTSALEIFQVTKSLEIRRCSFSNFYQTEDAFSGASEKINVPDGWEESLDECCLRHAREWNLE